MNWKVQFLLVVFSLVAAVRVVNAAAALELVEPSADHPNKCFRANDRLILGEGEQKNLKDCIQVSCQKQGEKFAIQTISCGVVAPNPKCKMIEDKTKDYPNCCPQQQCP